jgi:hypothetical protein
LVAPEEWDVMIVIPYDIGRNKYRLYLAMDEEDLKQMQEFNPFNFAMTQIADHWKTQTLQGIDLGYLRKEEAKHFLKAYDSTKDIVGALDWLSRGWKPNLSEGLSDGDVYGPVGNPMWAVVDPKVNE